ncbi:MAG: carboxypeptidase-like regulatory domain-containing protein [Bacteroidetes bacterium]|nr:carboxypeptidase-like regulatory domain-containing protein [Bacteroidota bacterium]
MKYRTKKYFFYSLFFFLLPFFLRAQTATLKGTVADSTGKKIEFASVSVFGTNISYTTDSSGNFKLNIPADKTDTIIVVCSGYFIRRESVFLKNGETKHLDVVMQPKVSETIIIKEHRDFEHIPPKEFREIVSTTGGDVKDILVHVGANTNNELSTQYSVRGGSFDENLVYVNGIEVYRPLLTRAGQQEGLSFVNVDMTDDIYFSAGGFEAKYGDKMASVLDITYREPTKFAGVASMSLLGASAEVEGISDNTRFTWMIGIREKSNKYLLRSLETKGDYHTNFTDVQTFLNYHITPELSISYLGNYAVNKYNLVPSTRQTDFGTINNALQFTVYFDGQEINRFNTLFNAVSLNYDRRHWNTKFILSSFNTYESEQFDVQGQYYIDQLEADFGKPTFGQVAFNRGVGTYINHARNYLNAWVNNAEIKTSRTTDSISWNFGLRFQNERIHDEISEWNYVDSAGYSIPYYPTSSIDLQDVIKSRAELFSNRIIGYGQMRWRKTLRDTSQLQITLGVRGNYWDMNNQLIVSPRAQLEWRPNSKKRNILFRLAGGLYDQPPFYKELRDLQGIVHRDVKAQTSVHAIAGTDVTFLAWGRPFRLIVEGYYKYLDNLIPYEVNDVRMRYFGANLSHGYAYGLDARLNGEFVKGVDSWVNISLLRTREDLYNDYYYIYKNSDGDTIIPGYTYNNVPVDSIKVTPGFIPRPTDQLLTFSLFFQDYLPHVESCKMNLGLIFGSGLPFGPPTHERYKAIFRMPPYRRVDIGFSYQIIKESKPLKQSSPFHFMKSLWVGMEVYNLLQVQNTISYYWVKDVTGRTYAVPNYLTNRQLSVRVIVRF